MIAPKHRIPMALFLASFAAGALAAKAPSSSPAFLKPDAVDPVALLSAPPIAGSLEAAMDLDAVRRLEKTRTAAEIARAHSENKLKLDAFTSAVGPWFTRENLPRLDALFHRLEATSKSFVKPAKAFFKRPRPAHIDPSLKAIIDERDDSYPSGHSTMATVDAIVLCELLPEYKAQLMARSQQIGWDRVIAGIHFPSDIYAGRVLGQAIARALLADPDFSAAFADARAEISAVHPTEKTAAVSGR